MRGLSVSILTGIVLLTDLPSSALAGAAPRQSVHAQTERYSVEALDTGGSDRPARVIVTDHVTSRKHMVMVNSTLGELTRALIREDQQRVTLVCTKGFAVLDPSGVASTDEVYGLDAVVSPNGQWIAFRRFFPPTHPGPSEGILVYDTRQSRDKNHGAYPIAAEREWRAGQAIFPPAESWRDANAVLEDREAWLLTSPLTWESGKQAPALLFSMRHGDDETVVLARPDQEQFRACWAPLPGSSAQWRVKTMTFKRVGDTDAVTVSSAAQATAAEIALNFPAACAGQVQP